MSNLMGISANIMSSFTIYGGQTTHTPNPTLGSDPIALRQHVTRRLHVRLQPAAMDGWFERGSDILRWADLSF